MRLILILVFSIWTLKGYSQIEPLKAKLSNSSAIYSLKQERADNDTLPSVIYEAAYNSDRKPAYFINGRYSTESILQTIDSRLIDNINILKEEILIEGKKYNGQIYIQLKKDYYPKLISLTDLKLKYAKQSNTPTIFMIDNDVIKGDYSKCIVDEKYILNIRIDTIENNVENFKIDMIHLLTRTDENIKKSKEIMIRGIADPM